MRRVLIMRHAQSAWNAEGRAQGWFDPPLSEAGLAQARALGPHLADLGVAGVVSSDLERARRTAAILAAAVGAPAPRSDARLRERDLGWWSGLTAPEMARGWPAEQEAWRAHRLERPPGGEAGHLLLARVRAALVDLPGPDPGDGVTLVVSHGGVISCLERELAGAGDPGRGGHPNLSGRCLYVERDQISLGAAFLPPVESAAVSAGPAGPRSADVADPSEPDEVS